MQEKSLKSLGLPVSKATLKPSAAVRISIEVELNKVVNECFTAIKEFNLSTLLEKAKKESFQKLHADEKELLRYGIIRLGEALTFCRDERNKVLASTGIVHYGKIHANARNHFIHHEFYHTHLGLYNVTQECIGKLPSILALEEKLENLKKSGLTKLSKPIRKGENDFPFEYDHFVRCLDLELSELKRILALPEIGKQLSNNVLLKAKLNNHIRNILAIMVDLTDKDLINKNKGDSCTEQKRAVDKINRTFWEKFEQFAELFMNYKEFRNSLCHLDENLKKPYNGVNQMIEFAQHLEKMQELGYVKQLQEKLIQKQDQKVIVQAEEKKESAKRYAESSTISTPAAASSETTVLAKKAKEEPEKKQEKEKQNIDPLASLLEYKSDEESSALTSTPGMKRG